MKYEERKMDLFDVSKDYYLVHCISADFKLGAGIAVLFDKKFNLKNKLKKAKPNSIIEFDNDTNPGSCIAIIDNYNGTDFDTKVFNLITKRNYWNKPTYETLKNALLELKFLVQLENVQKIAMPLIGCGLDKLQWEKVSLMLKEIFADTNIEILICIK